MTIKISTLSNGLRVASDTMKEAESLVLGAWVGVGTRHEPWNASGIAHMTEHMLFKGTQKRTAYTLATAIENRGGSMNAYTTREETAYYARVLPENAALAADIISDMIMGSLFENKEMDRERKVIIQEIGRDKDTPEDHIDDLLHETAFPKQKLGRPILGTTKAIETISREQILRYVRSHYHANNIVIVGTGRIEHEALCRLAEDYFAGMPKGRKSSHDRSRVKTGELRQTKDSEQLHMYLSFAAPGLHSRSIYALNLLAVLLGGSSSSRLFQKVREKRGLVYHISASHLPYHETGLFNIYAGTDPSRGAEILPVICRELNDVKSHITPSELRRAKAQIRAELLMGQENVMRRAEMLGHQMLTFGKPHRLSMLLEKVSGLSAEELQQLASSLFSGAPILTTLGPAEKVESYETLAERLS